MMTQPKLCLCGSYLLRCAHRNTYHDTVDLPRLMMIVGKRLKLEMSIPDNVRVEQGRKVRISSHNRQPAACMVSSVLQMQPRQKSTPLQVQSFRKTSAAATLQRSAEEADAELRDDRNPSRIRCNLRPTTLGRATFGVSRAESGRTPPGQPAKSLPNRGDRP